MIKDFAKNVSSGDRLQAVSLSAQGYSRQTNKRVSAKSPSALKRGARVEPLMRHVSMTRAIFAPPRLFVFFDYP